MAAHHDFVSCDMRDNPGFHPGSETNTLLKYAFLKNIRKSILQYHKTRMRLKLEWIFPHAIGMAGNNLDDCGKKVIGNLNRNLFLKLVNKIAHQIELSFEKCLAAFMGNDQDELL